MNSSNALGFAIVGLAMRYLPVWFPSMMGSASAESVRVIWLLFMSTVLMAIAMGYYASLVWKTRTVWTGWVMRPVAGALAARRQAAASASTVQPSRARVSV